MDGAADFFDAHVVADVYSVFDGAPPARAECPCAIYTGLPNGI